LKRGKKRKLFLQHRKKGGEKGERKYVARQTVPLGEGKKINPRLGREKGELHAAGDGKIVGSV